MKAYDRVSDHSESIILPMGNGVHLLLDKLLCATSLLLTTLLLTSAIAQGQNVKSYPPYPDIWDWQLSKTSADEILSIYKLQDGDIIFFYRTSRKKNARNEVASTFFGKNKYTNRTVDEIAKTSLENSKKIKTSAGHFILSNPGPTVQNCYHGLYSNVSLVDFADEKAGELKAIKTKVFLYVLPAPRTHASPSHCNETPTFKVFVTAIEGDLVPLDDKTMLLVDRKYGVAVRIDENIDTHSRLLNAGLFVLDQSELDEWLSEGHFGDRTEPSGIDFARMQNDLVQWLSKKRKGVKK